MKSHETVRSKLKQFGLAYPEAHSKSPWPGHDDLAVRNKTFAYLNAAGEPLSISCKLPLTGQMALTWYLFHIVVGAAYVRKHGWHTAGTVTNGLLVGVVFFAIVVVLSTLWKRYFKYGPMEWVLRNVSK